MVRSAFQFGQGAGDILNMPAVYALKLFSSQVVSSIFGISGGFLACPTGNSTIYENATALLGDDVCRNCPVYTGSTPRACLALGT